MLWSELVYPGGGTLPPAHDASRVGVPHRASHFYTPKDTSKATGSKRTAMENASEMDEPSARRHRPSNTSRKEHLLSDDTLNAALQGEHRDLASGKQDPHKACGMPLPDGAPCFQNLWTSKAAYKAHVERFLDLSQEMRSSVVFSLLKDQFYCDSDAHGNAVGEAKWHYVVNTDHGQRHVCQHVFLLAYPVSRPLLFRLQRRILDGCTSAHAKNEEGATSSIDSGPTKTDDIVGWYIAYANHMGDYMPDGQEIIVPRRWRSDEFDEYEHSFGADAASYQHFCYVLKNAPELAHICRARKLLNFQHCTTCVDLNETVAKAIKSRDPERVKQAKAARSSHHTRTRAERLVYYSRRELGRTFPDKLSLILDKWDSAKTTVPYFARSPGHWWSSLKHNVLEQHVLGVRVHEQPNRDYFFTINGTIGGGANLNVEGIRRVLIDLYADIPLPRTIYIQADNASDNKCWTVLLFLAMLVFHGYTHDVYLSFLLVGHTHEDIDQVFSVLSRFLKSIGRVVDPKQFESDLKAAMQARPATFERILSVFAWDSFLRPSLRTSLPVGIQHSKIGDETLVPHTFWIHKRPDGQVVFHYKELAADPVWLPPLVPNATPLVTDPQGIEFLDPSCPLPDPLVTPPTEMEFVV